MSNKKITALILLENHFVIDSQQNVWCDRIVDYNYLQRYLNVFDNIVVCGRFTKTTKCTNKLLVSGKNVEFLQLPEFIGMKGLLKNYKKIRRIINRGLRISFF